MTVYIYRTVADCFPYIEVEYEYDNIDAVLYDSNSIKFPDDLTDNDVLVAIEHEHKNPRSELTKLAGKNYPLNVVITYLWEGNATNPDFREK